MHPVLKNFRNAHWFRRHPYAYLNLLRRRLDEATGRPFLRNAELCFDVTCNYRCIHCSISALQHQKETRSMTFKQVERVADELKALHCFTCCLVGGEPTIRKDFPDIIRAFNHRRILPTMITNGFFITPEYMNILVKAGIFAIGISMNGFSAATHDKFVRSAGSFDRQMRAIDIAIKSGVGVSIAVVPTHENLKNGEYERLIKFAEIRKIRVNVNYPALAGQYTAKYDELLNREEIASARKYFDLPNVTSDFTVMGGNYECPAGRKKVYILPDGSVCPCTFIHISYGNILTESLMDIMKRIWKTPLFMSRPKMCLTGESLSFNKKYLGPVFENGKVPMDYRDHPLLKKHV